MKKHITTCGIPGVGVVPQDYHFCHFYPSREELIEALMPYFDAGLTNNERCIWLTASPLHLAEVKTELIKHPPLQRAEQSGKLLVQDSHDWYGQSVPLDADKYVQRWIDEEERALADGYRGLRIAGNANFVPRDNWDELMEYERKFHDRTRGRRIVTCCSYPHHQCRPIDILEVARTHDAALDRDETTWQVYLQNSSIPGLSDGAVSPPRVRPTEPPRLEPRTQGLRTARKRR